MLLFIYLGFDPFPIEGIFIIQRKEKGEGILFLWSGWDFPTQLPKNSMRGGDEEVWCLNFEIEILK